MSREIRVYHVLYRYIPRLYCQSSKVVTPIGPLPVRQKLHLLDSLDPRCLEDRTHSPRSARAWPIFQWHEGPGCPRVTAQQWVAGPRIPQQPSRSPKRIRRNGDHSSANNRMCRKPLQHSGRKRSPISTQGPYEAEVTLSSADACSRTRKRHGSLNSWMVSVTQLYNRTNCSNFRTKLIMFDPKIEN
jgi:hypothetical protein